MQLKLKLLSHPEEEVTAQGIPQSGDGITVTKYRNITEEPADRRIVIEDIVDTHAQGGLADVDKGGSILSRQVEIVLTTGAVTIRPTEVINTGDVTPGAVHHQVPWRDPGRAGGRGWVFHSG